MIVITSAHLFCTPFQRSASLSASSASLETSGEPSVNGRGIVHDTQLGLDPLCEACERDRIAMPWALGALGLAWSKVAFGVVELQGAGDRFQHAVGYPGKVVAFEALVIVGSRQRGWWRLPPGGARAPADGCRHRKPVRPRRA